MTNLEIDANKVKILHVEDNPHHCKYYASWDFETGRHFNGCALGRGCSEKDAEFDLVRRTNDENDVNVVLVGNRGADA